MWKIFLILFLGCSPAYSFEPDGNSYSRKEYEERHRTLKRGHPIRVEQPVVVDRYDVRKLQNDPAVLVSAPVQKPAVQIVEKIVYVERKPIVATISAEWE